MQKEIQALRGKDLFGKNSHDLCLVPNVKIPHKFKVPYFEKVQRQFMPSESSDDVRLKDLDSD